MVANRSLRRPVKVVIRGLAFLWLVVRILIEYAGIRCRGRLDRAARNDWMHSSARRIARLLGVRIHTVGAVPATGLVVSNHLGYLDIVVLGALMPATFVSKSEVKWWPVVGILTSLSGTVYVRRQDKFHLRDIRARVAGVFKEGSRLVLFPEGTSTDGSRVLPFRSSLLEPAVQAGAGVTPVFLRYRIAEGSAADEVCYWRDMTFLPHLLNLFALDSIDAEVVFGEGILPAGTRKEMAAQLRERVVLLGGLDSGLME